MTWAGPRARTRLAVTGVTLGALVAAAPAGSASALGGQAAATGNFNRVPIVNGTNRDEWRLFVALSELAGDPVTAPNYQSMISSTFGVPAAAAAVIAAKYPLNAFPSPSIALGAAGTDAIFACPALTIDQSVSHFVPTFAYEFSDENARETSFPGSASPTVRPTRPRSST